MSTFKDHFSDLASDYVRYRPRYPEALYTYLATLTPGHERAWDCGTGNGQAAHALTPHFTHIVATDPSADQLALAVPHARIDYRAEPAEQTTLAPASVDLVTVATAVHWFDFDRFYAEVRRLLKPGGVIAVWSYLLLRILPAVDAILDGYAHGFMGTYWPPERRYVNEAYQTIPFP